MSSLGKPYITGIGSFSPGDPIPFDGVMKVLGDLPHAPPRLGKWIERMQPLMKDVLGMEHYHYAIDPVTRTATEDNITMSVKAAKPAMEQAGVLPADIDLLVFASSMMENMSPPTSVLIQEALGIPRCAEMAIHSNCTSIYKAIQVAADLVMLGRYRRALVVTSQLCSPFLRAEHYHQEIMTKDQAILRWFLCDGAGALVISAEPRPGGIPSLQVTDTYLESAGLGLGPDMYCLLGGQRVSPLDIHRHGWHHLTQNFTEISKIAPPLYRQCIDNMLAKTGFRFDDRTTFFFNIPTKHMMELCTRSMAEDFKAPRMRFYTRLSERGYCGPPAIIIALDAFIREGGCRPGDHLVSVVTESSKWMHIGFILEAVG